MIDETDFICLATLPKSGTHYTHHFLVNYLRRLAGLDGETLFSIAAHRAYPNRRYDYILDQNQTYITPDPLPPGLRDIVVQHGFSKLENFPGWVITLMRNPLDFVVSNYHYRYKSRIDAELEKVPLSSVVADYTQRWLIARGQLARLMEADTKVFFAKYEDLVAEPHKVFADMVAFLGQPLDHALLDRTIDDIQADKFKKAGEQTRSKILKAPFVRNGRNRQWEAEMTPADVDVARSVFQIHDLDLDAIMAEWGLPLPPRPEDAAPLPIEAVRRELQERKLPAETKEQRSEKLAQTAAQKRAVRAAAAEKRRQRAALAEAHKATAAKREARASRAEEKAALRAEKQKRAEAALAERAEKIEAIRAARREAKVAKAAEVREARRIARAEALAGVPRPSRSGRSGSSSST